MIYILNRGDDCSKEEYDAMLENHELDCVFPVAQDLLDQYETMYPNHHVEKVTLTVHPGPVVDQCERIVFERKMGTHDL